MTHYARRRQRGFTLVEMIVVIGTIALLLAALMPAIGYAKRRSAKVSELNNLRQYGIAWSLYASRNEDNLLPGYIDPEVQAHWDAEWDYPPAVTSSGVTGPILPEYAAPYTWRLLPLMDGNHELVHFHLDEVDPDPIAEAEEVAYEPAFGYNALFVGGWWQMDGDTPRVRYWDTKSVATRMSQVNQPDRLLLFCSAAVMPPIGSGASTPFLYHEVRDYTPGWHMVAPPEFRITPTGPPAQLWRSGTTIGGSSGGGGGAISVGTGLGDDSVVEVLTTTLPGGGSDPSQNSSRFGTPIGRYTDTVAVLWADLSATTEQPGAIAKSKMWIYNAP